MAVPYFKRSVSKKEYMYHFKHRLQPAVIDLLKRDFNINTDSSSWEEKNPWWLIQQKRTELLKSLALIRTCISRAGFYPKDLKEKEMKQRYQLNAIQECYVLYDNLEACTELFSPIKNINVFTLLATQIKDEITYLKYWRKYTDRVELPETDNKPLDGEDQ